MDTEAQAEMPKYQCHKRVHALKIAGVEIHKDRSATIAPADPGFAPFQTEPGWANRFDGDEDNLGYYVVYDGGAFASWSPAKPFEAGYTRIDGRPTPAQVIRDAQKILASYLPPDGISQHQAIGELLDLLDGPRARAALGDD